MSRAARNRRNRRDTGVRGAEMLCGAVVDVKVESTGRESLFEITPVVPTSASFAGRIDDRLLPGED